MPEIWFNNLNIKIYKLDGVILNLNGFKIYWYGVLIALAIAIGLVITAKRAKKTNQDPELYADFAFYAIIVSFIFARLYYVIFSFENYKNNPLKIFALREGGLAIYGGVIGAILTAYIFSKKRKIKFFKLTDTVIPALILGQSIGRWGNFFNKEAFGSFTDSIFSMRILKTSAKYIPQSLENKIIEINGFEYLQVHPTFLYESIWNLLIFIILIIYRKKYKKKDGEILALYLLGYGFGRFFIEGLRTDQLLILNTNIPISQVVALISVVISVVLIYFLRKSDRSEVS